MKNNHYNSSINNSNTVNTVLINQTQDDLVAKALKRFKIDYPGLDREQESELYDAGRKALEKAIDNFDSQRGCSFKTYSERYVWYAFMDTMRSITSYTNKFVRLDCADNADLVLNTFRMWQDEQYDSELEYRIYIVRTGVELLPDKDRALVKCYFGFDGDPQTLQSIAQQLGVSFQAVAKRLHRIENQLRAYVLRQCA